MALAVATAFAAGAAALAGAPEEAWPARDEAATACVRENHRALGRLLVVLAGRPASAPEEVFLRTTPVEWIGALRGASFFVRDEGARPAIRVVETDGSTLVEVPLPAKDEEIAEKLRGRLYARAKVRPDARFRKPLAPEFEVPAPPPFALADVGPALGFECALAAPDGRRAYLGTRPCEGDLAAAEAEARASLETALRAGKLSNLQHGKAARPSGKIKVSFETADGEKGAAVFELAKKAIAGAVVAGKGASEKEAEALLQHLKKGLKSGGAKQ